MSSGTGCPEFYMIQNIFGSSLLPNSRNYQDGSNGRIDLYTQNSSISGSTLSCDLKMSDTGSPNYIYYNDSDYTKKIIITHKYKYEL